MTNAARFTLEPPYTDHGHVVRSTRLVATARGEVPQAAGASGGVPPPPWESYVPNPGT